MFLLDVEAVDVIEIAIPGFGHYGQAAVEHAWHPSPAPFDHRVANGAHAVGVGDGDGIQQQPVVFDPGRSGHLAVAIETEPSRENF
jgi:hypothetical protein